MACKRMFDRAIIDTDRFMDLPMSSKALYFLLGMEADDEGFVSYKKVLRIHGGNEDDVKVLISKQFLISFPTGVVVITDWNTNNWLDNRRIKETEYQKEKKQLILTDNKKYVLSKCLASIVENRTEESSIEYIAEASSAQKENLPEVIPNLLEDKQKHIYIIGLFARAKEISFSSKEQQRSFIKRNLRAAQNLKAYTGERIIEVLKHLRDNADFKWTLETVGKFIDDDLTKIKIIGQSEEDIIKSILNK